MRIKIYILFIHCFLAISNCYSQSNGSCGGGGGGEGGGASSTTQGSGPADPNLILSPVGFSNQRWVSVKDNMGFAIYFENDPNLATAPVHNVYIYFKYNIKYH